MNKDQDASSSSIFKSESSDKSGNCSSPVKMSSGGDTSSSLTSPRQPVARNRSGQMQIHRLLVTTPKDRENKQKEDPEMSFSKLLQISGPKAGDSISSSGGDLNGSNSIRMDSSSNASSFGQHIHLNASFQRQSHQSMPIGSSEKLSTELYDRRIMSLSSGALPSSSLPTSPLASSSEGGPRTTISRTHSGARRGVRRHASSSNTEKKRGVGKANSFGVTKARPTPSSDGLMKPSRNNSFGLGSLLKDNKKKSKLKAKKEGNQ